MLHTFDTSYLTPEKEKRRSHERVLESHVQPGDAFQLLATYWTQAVASEDLLDARHAVHVAALG